MKALIICNDFPPLNSIGADRPYSWYKYFKKNGIEPIVITKNWKGEIQNSHDVISNISNTYNTEQSELGTIIRTPHATTLPEKIIKLYGIASCVTFRKAITFIYKLLSFHCSFFDQHYPLYKAAKSFLKKNNVDIIITSGEPFILNKYGFLLSQSFSLPWIADYRDGWYCNHVTSISNNALTKILRWNEYMCEKKWIRQSTAISTVDPLLAKTLKDMHAKPTIVSYNGFWEIYPTNQHVSTLSLTLCHTGTLTPGQRVEFLLEAVKELIEKKQIQETDISMQFIGLEYFEEQYKRVITYSSSLHNCIKTTPRVPYHEAIRMSQSSDFLINFTEEHNTAIYAKTYTYMACGKKILVLPTDNSLLEEIVTKYSLGNTFTDKQTLQNFICEMVAAKKNGTLDTRITNTVGLNFFSREHQTKNFTEEIKKIVAC